jgi:hypothetical protein
LYLATPPSLKLGNSWKANFPAHLEVTRQSVHEPFRVRAQDGFVRKVFLHLTVTDLLNLDIGECGIVEQPDYPLINIREVSDIRSDYVLVAFGCAVAILGLGKADEARWRASVLGCGGSEVDPREGI